MTEPNCVTCAYLSTKTQHSVCQRVTSAHYSRKVLQRGVLACDKWEKFEGIEGRSKADRDWLRLIG
jgi:hypothetical protein